MNNTKLKLLKIKEKLMEDKNINYFTKNFEIVVLRWPKNNEDKENAVYYFYFDKNPIFFNDNISDFLSDIKADKSILVEDLDKISRKEKKFTFNDVISYQLFLSKCIKFGSFVGIIDFDNKSFRRGMKKLFASIKYTEKTTKLKEKIKKIEKEYIQENEIEKQ